MKQRPRTTSDRFSRVRRSVLARVALGLCLVAGGLVVGWWVGLTLLNHQVSNQRAMSPGEPPAQLETPPAAPPSVGESDRATEPSTLAAPAPAPAAPAVSPHAGKALTERFEGDSVSDRWFISDGWSNGSWMANDWRASAVEVTPAGLSLHLGPSDPGSDYALAGGEIRTVDFFLYGYFEARIKVPRDPGLVAGLFTYADRQGSLRHHEIDIEILGRAPRVAELTIHENGRATTKKINLPFDASSGFHTLGFDWQPGHVRWYAEGILIHEETGPVVRKLVRPQQLLISLWASQSLSSWVGRLDTRKGPWRLEVSCIAYRQVYAGQVCR